MSDTTRDSECAPLRTFTLQQALADPALLVPPAAVAPPFLYAGRVTLLAAREKVGKSTLAAQAAAAISVGGIFLETQLSAGDVLWIGLDESLNDTVRRFVAMEASPTRLVLCDERPSAAGLSRVLAAGSFALVVVDTLNELLPGASLNRSEEVLPYLRPFVNAIRESGAAGLVICHASKSSGQYLGSVTIGGLMDAPLSLKRAGGTDAVVADPNAEPDDDAGADDGRRVLVGPTRWGGRLRIRLAFDGRTYRLGDAPLPLFLRILRELEQGESSASALAERLGARKENVLAEVRGLEARGCLRRARTGLEVTDAGREVLRSGGGPDLGTVPMSAPAVVLEPHKQSLASPSGTAGNRLGSESEPPPQVLSQPRFPPPAPPRSPAGTVNGTGSSL